jgi:translation initiation factor 4A
MYTHKQTSNDEDGASVFRDDAVRALPTDPGVHGSADSVSAGAKPASDGDVKPYATRLEPVGDLYDEHASSAGHRYDVEAIESFDDMGFSDDLLRGIYAYGFEKPSAIQQRAIKPLTQRRDVIAQAQSGTGKTATFSIGILSSIAVGNPWTQAIILANTRELATQSEKVVRQLGEYMGVTSLACIGGGRVREDMEKLRAGVQVVVGTPGRIFDLLKRRALRVDSLFYVVLDEADEMLSGNFKDQVYDIFQEVPASAAVGLFSATMPDEVLELTKKRAARPKPTTHDPPPSSPRVLT